MKKIILWIVVIWWIIWLWMYSWVTFDDIQKMDSKTIQNKIENKINETTGKITSSINWITEINSDNWEDEVIENENKWPYWDIKDLERIYWNYDWIKWKTYNFSQAKKTLENRVYDKKEDRIDNYCWYEYQEDKSINLNNTWYKVQSKNDNRAKRIEWEHVVPAENFWRAFKEWREWNPKLCWEWVKWRKCAWKNETFSKMEWDIYNLIPVVWEVNWFRSNINYWMVTNKDYIYFGNCNFKIDRKDKVAEPTDYAKWQVARISMYFAIKYKEYYRISDQQLKLFQAWNKQYPPTEYECRISKEKAEFAWYENIVTKKECENNWFK